ncbi:MAG TPA: AMP-binding protein [Kofleriaceae bacterium]|jgi:long-chain acyl-CoA synthetase|nr:AMP-binding protein [Kofleriaceae bacterium]
MIGNDTDHLIPHDLDLLSFLDGRFARFAGAPALRLEGSFELSYDQLRAQIVAVSSRLIARGLSTNARVALLSENRPEWSIAMLGALRAGAMVVPLDTKLGTSEITTLLAHAKPRVILASTAQRARAIEAARAAGIGSDRVLIIDDGSITSAGDIAPPVRTHDDVALIVYTSGTTGSPKGVTITFGNLMHQVRAVGAAIGPQGRERFLSVLPLCHLYELICGLLVPLSRGATISYPAGETLLPAELSRIMRERKITSLVGVPLLYRALSRGIDAEVKRASRGARIFVAMISAIAAVIPLEKLRRAIHRPILKSFGGALHQLYAGGAPLDPEVAKRFERMGLRIFQGYGLSETSPVIATCTPRAYRRGSVGRPLPGVEVRIADGEIQTRGPNVMRGYLDRADLTKDVFTRDGWFKTGDLGHLDDDGYLHVTGRAKDVIVLGGGKKVYPDEVELLLADHPGFAEVCVLGVPNRHGHEEVCAVVVPAAAQGEADPEEEIARMLEGVAAFKRPTRVLVRREPIPRTTTRKAKRQALAAWITNDLEQAA